MTRSHHNIQHAPSYTSQTSVAFSSHDPKWNTTTEDTLNNKYARTNPPTLIMGRRSVRFKTMLIVFTGPFGM